MPTINLHVAADNAADIVVEALDITPLEAATALLRAAQYVVSAVARSVSADLGFKVVADRGDEGKFVTREQVEEFNEFEQVMAAAPQRAH